MAVSSPPVVSLVIVSDYGGDEWSQRALRLTLRAVAAQRFDETVETILVENEDKVDRIPAAVLAELPGVRVLAAAATSSYALKNHGARAAKAPFIAILDGDIVPEPDWLGRAVATLRAHPSAAVVSARTVHTQRHFLARALALLERGYLDRGDPGPTRYFGNHAAVFRRDALLAHPFHEHAGPFSSCLQSEAMRRAGYDLWFEPGAVVAHAYDGWRAQLDVLRNAGFGTVVTRQIDRDQPCAWLVGLGVAAIPLIVAGKLWMSFGDCLRCYRHYGIRTHELPALLGLAVVARCLEAPGMWRALRGRPLRTAFR